jgi:hypothetical protein
MVKIKQARISIEKINGRVETTLDKLQILLSNCMQSSVMLLKASC